MATTMHNNRRRSLSLTHGSPTTPKPCSSAVVHTGVKKKFACSFADCAKSFSRSEHLHRHALNHKEGNNTCPRCSAHFRRRDLLDRHMARHREKDNEAGGEGLGILATRKRLWRDDSGRIVNARRPASINAPKMANLSIDTSVRPTTKRRASSARERKSKAALPSPPMSSMSSRTRSVSPRAQSAPSTAQLPPSAYLPSSPPAHAPGPHKLEDAPPLDPWLTSNHGVPLPLPSPPMSEASLGSAAKSHPPHHHHTASHEPSLYDEPHHSSWSVLHPDASPEQHGHPRSRPPYMHPSPQHWGPPATQPFQTFMGSVGSQEHVHAYPHEEDEMGIFKPELGVSAPPMNVGAGLGMGMYDWNNGQPAWANGGVGMMSRVREERYESPAAASQEKRGPGSAPWPGYHAPSPVYASRGYARC